MGNRCGLSRPARRLARSSYGLGLLARGALRRGRDSAPGGATDRLAIGAPSRLAQLAALGRVLGRCGCARLRMRLAVGAVAIVVHMSCGLRAVELAERPMGAAVWAILGCWWIIARHSIFAFLMGPGRLRCRPGPSRLVLVLSHPSPCGSLGSAGAPLPAAAAATGVVILAPLALLASLLDHIRPVPPLPYRSSSRLLRI
jgi:hypothetical protein